jgi:hypothetical protein
MVPGALTTHIARVCKHHSRCMHSCDQTCRHLTSTPPSPLPVHVHDRVLAPVPLMEGEELKRGAGAMGEGAQDPGE